MRVLKFIIAILPLILFLGSPMAHGVPPQPEELRKSIEAIILESFPSARNVDLAFRGELAPQGNHPIEKGGEAMLGPFLAVAQLTQEVLDVAAGIEKPNFYLVSFDVTEPEAATIHCRMESEYESPYWVDMSVDFPESGDYIKLTDLTYRFTGCSKVVSIPFEAEGALTIRNRLNPSEKIHAEALNIRKAATRAWIEGD